jgi:hypothetical protein
MATTGSGLKKVSYQLIQPDSPSGRTLYAVLADLVEQYHEEIRHARIALAWNLAWKPDVDGRVTLGKCKKASDLDRELAAYDFVIILRREFMEDPNVSDDQRRALIDHELCHASVKLDDEGEPVEDERGRVVYRIRKHDLEEFSEIAQRYGCYKRDLEDFAKALERSRSTPLGAWVGYRSLQEQLRLVDVNLALDVIVTWSDLERREVQAWAVMRRELRKAPGELWKAEEAAADGMPACLAAAMNQQQTA